ncbi:hypothetical protein MNBD_PLANCTO03-819 [hydrothermal vent metagenome]|uniref:Uncharacterized protein n=1 Tax=hydrothermal vent metagenome TaxID=652676 RepID=A0A3B1DZ31_9ZZZZ
MPYPDCYEPAEHRRALAKVLDDLKAAEETDAQAECAHAEQHEAEGTHMAQPDPVVQVRSTCPEAVDLAHEPVN